MHTLHLQASSIYLAAQTCAQVLLSLGNLANRMQYLNASNTFTELFSYGTVPIVNENDTVAVEELRIGDNDTLSAQVCITQSLSVSPPRQQVLQRAKLRLGLHGALVLHTMASVQDTAASQLAQSGASSAD